MSNQKIIAVVGATGSQGGGLARAILDDPSGEFALRAITRHPESEAAKALAARGAEIVQADLDDESSMDKAFDGSYGVFVVTAFWEYFSPEREKAHAKTAAEAAKRAGLEHVVWSTLPDTRLHIPVEDKRIPVIGEYQVPHFDAKGEADKYFLDAGVPTTFLSTTFYFEAFLTHFKPVRREDGILVLSLPMADKKLAGVAAEDIGRTAFGIFKQGKDLVGETVNLAGESLTGAQYAAKFAEALGETVVYQAVDPEAIRASGAPAAAESANTFLYYIEAEAVFTLARDTGYIRTLNPALQDFGTWLAGHQSEF